MAKAPTKSAIALFIETQAESIAELIRGDSKVAQLFAAKGIVLSDAADSDEEEDEDEPAPKGKKAPAKSKGKKAPVEDEEDWDEEDEEPAPKGKKAPTKGKKAPVEDDEDEDEGDAVRPVTPETALLEARMRNINTQIKMIGAVEKDLSGNYAGKVQGIMIGLVFTLVIGALFLII